MVSNLIEINDLCVSFDNVPAVIHASLRIEKGETVALVGESGSGKSVTALSILQLLPYPQASHPGGSILVDGREVIGADEVVLRKIRGAKISMVFQEPMTSLNPLHNIQKQIEEILYVHRDMTGKAANDRILELLKLVGLQEAEKRLKAFPHELSGGQRQRVMIAMALANEPDLLIADEPTTALDVTIQAQILDLIKALQEHEGMSVLLITHDLAVVAENAHHVAVMYAGKVVEYAQVEELYEHPKHPYTIGLFRSLPDLVGAEERLYTIPGIVPSAFHFPSGCRYRTRCPIATDACTDSEPALNPLAEGDAHTVACHHLEEAERL